MAQAVLSQYIPAPWTRMSRRDTPKHQAMKKQQLPLPEHLIIGQYCGQHIYVRIVFPL